jgi:hypothetical protein
MCCRNDNEGEVPSKLEVLTSMASELASSAVENGRWHHLAASKALADQLSPEGGSLLQESPVAFCKSMSSYNLVSFGDSSNSVTNELPAMSQATGSDTSSDTGDHEECDDWAASVIADVSLEKRMSILQKSMQFKPRSASVCSEHSSDTNLSSSPRGFWYIRPGSSPDDADSDSDSISWSQHLVSKNDDPDKNFDEEEGVKLKTPRIAAFADSFTGGFHVTPPATVNVSTFKKAESETFPVLKKRASGLNRSQSYSAFSELRRMSSTFSNRSGESSGLASVDEGEKFRGYFCKFVDLVIVREMTALASLQLHEQEHSEEVAL